MNLQTGNIEEADEDQRRAATMGAAGIGPRLTGPQRAALDPQRGARGDDVVGGAVSVQELAAAID